MFAEKYTHTHAHIILTKLSKFSTAFATDKLFMAPTKFGKIENKAKH